MNILSGYEHMWGILLVTLIDVCTAASAQSLSWFLCIEIEFYEKAHLRSIIETHTHTHRYVLALLLAGIPFLSPLSSETCKSD